MTNLEVNTGGLTAKQNRERVARLQKLEKEKEMKRWGGPARTPLEEAEREMENTRQRMIEMGDGADFDDDLLLKGFIPRNPDGHFSRLKVVSRNTSCELVKDESGNFYVRFTPEFLRYQEREDGMASPKYLNREALDWLEGNRLYSMISDIY